MLLIVSSFASATSTDEFYISDIVSGWYLNDTNEDGLVNETSGVDDSWGLNDGQLYGKTFNHGTNNGATLHNNLTGTITGATWEYDAELGRDVLSFDGDGDYVEHGFTNTKNNTPLTYRVKAKFNTYSDVTTYSLDILSTPYILLRQRDNDLRLRWDNSGAQTVNCDFIPNIGQLYEITATFNGEQSGSIYIDGELCIAQTKGFPPSYSGQGNYVSSGSGSFNGTISDVIILDKALNSTEVLELYETGQVNTDGYYHEINFPLDEGTGTEVYTKEGKFGGYYDIPSNASFSKVIETSLQVDLSNDFTYNFIYKKKTEIPQNQYVSYEVLFDPSRTSGNFRGDYYNDECNNGIYFRTANYGLCTQELDTNTYYQISIIKNSTNINLYVDNVLKDTSTNMIAELYAINDFNVFNYFNGSIDEVKIWNRALSETEIQEEMNANAVANPEGIVAYYDFNERGGNTVYDNNHLTTGARQSTSSLDEPAFRWDKGMNFDGVDDYVNRATISELDNDKNYSVSMWVNTNSIVGINKMLLINTLPGDNRNVMSLENDRFSVGYYDGSTNGKNTNNPISENTWYHLVYTLNEKEIAFYLNAISQTGTANPTFSSDASFNLGGRPSLDRQFNGSIADVRIYDRALTEDEVKTLYNGLNRVNFTAEEYLTEQSITNFTINSIYGNKTTTNGLVQLDVPYGDITYDWTNQEKYYNQSNLGATITTENQEVATIGNNSNITFYFNEYVYNNVLPQVKLVPTAFPTLTQTYAITGASQTTEFVAGQFYVDVYIDGSRITRETITINEGNNNINLTDIGMNYVYFYDKTSSEALNNTNITLIYPSSTSLDLVTDSNGRINFTTFQGESLEYGNYSITYNSDVGYVTPVTFTYNATSLPFNISYNITRVEISINIYDEVSSNRINGTNITVDIIGETSQSYTTQNGSIVFDFYFPGEYEFRYYSIDVDDYKLRSSFITITSVENQEINLYLLNESSTEITTATRTFKVYNQNLEGVEGATVTVARYFSSCNCYLDVWSRKTDSNAQAIGQFETIDAFYRYRAEYGGDVKYISGSEGTQWSTSGETPIFISTTASYYNDYLSLQSVDYTPISFTNQTNTTGYFEFTYSYISAIDVCLEVQESSYLNLQTNTTCVKSTGSTIYFNVDAGSTAKTYLARAKIKISDELGFQTVDTESVNLGGIQAPTGELWIYNMTWLAILITMASVLLYINSYPRVALVFQGTTFLVLTALPIKFVNISVTAGVVAFCVVLFIVHQMRR